MINRLKTFPDGLIESLIQKYDEYIASGVIPLESQEIINKAKETLVERGTPVKGQSDEYLFLDSILDVFGEKIRRLEDLLKPDMDFNELNY